MDATAILIIFFCFFGLKLFWESMLILLNIKSIRSNALKIPLFVKGVIDKTTYSKSVEYSISRNKFALSDDFMGALFLVLIISSGFFGFLDNFIYNLNLGSYFHGLLFIFSIGFIFGLFSLPFSLYSQFVIEARFGFNKQTLGLFFVDRIKTIILSIIIITPLYLILLWFLETTGGWWWILAFCFYVLFQLFITVIYPTLIAPLFNKFTPITEGSLKEKIEMLLKKVDYKSKGIFIMDGSKRSGHSNAYFFGIGKTKRIVLFDTLINILKEDEIIAVLAHEIGHQKKKHIVKMFIISLLSMLLSFFIIDQLLFYQPLYAAFGFARLSFHAILVLLGLCSGAFTFVFTPIFSLLSRKYEYEADRYAAQKVENGPSLLKQALLSLSKDNLSNLAPHPWYSFYHYSHPTLGERIRILEKIA
jgi:STE24 endopeptidase